MKVAYRAFDRTGRELNDLIDAGGLAEAGDQLRKQGLFVVELTERRSVLDRPGAARADSRLRAPGRGLSAGGRSARLKDVAAFFRQLTVLVGTGTPMVEALGAVERQAVEGRWRNTVADIRRRVEEGATLADAMQPHPAYFDAVCRSLVSAGESGGSIEAMMGRLTVLTRQQLKTRNSVTGAMVYPCLLLCVSVGVLGVMMGFVLPRFEGLFQTLGAPLPPTTRLLMDFSTFCRAYWWALLIAAAGLVFGAKMWLASPAGRDWLHGFVLRVPLFGPVVRAFATARIARVLGALLEGRVPLLEALQLTRESSGNTCFERLIARAEDEVTRGGTMSAVFAQSPLVSKSVTEAVRSGEKTGQIGPVMVSIAEFLEEDNEIVLRSLTSLIEPIILITLGLLVGFVAVSMFLPLFDLATTTRGA